jgi:hypothetical protein
MIRRAEAKCTTDCLEEKVLDRVVLDCGHSFHETCLNALWGEDWRDYHPNEGISCPRCEETIQDMWPFTWNKDG